MSTIFPDPTQHPAGYWEYPAAVLARCFHAVAKSGPEVITLVPAAVCRDIDRFFTEVEESLEEETLLYHSTQYVARRVLDRYTECPRLLPVIDSEESMRKEIKTLAARFRALVSGQMLYTSKAYQEFIRLIFFLEELAFLERRRSFHERSIFAEIRSLTSMN